MGKVINREVFKINTDVKSTIDARMELNKALLLLNTSDGIKEVKEINDFVESNIQYLGFDSMLLLSVMLKNLYKNRIFNTDIFNKYFPQFKITTIFK